MHFAALNGQIDAMRWLHAQRPDVIDRNKRYRNSLLEYARLGNQVEVVKWLLLPGEEESSTCNIL